ncbi:MAG: acyltransferase [Candidatus Azobacteroides sp.]|nr:acyltransferase [Candidatus Azobacteroides sp.]
MSHSQATFSPPVSEKNSFDFLRLLFAFSVFIAHFGVLTSIPVKFPISSSMGVAGFFIISGFLITQSYYRSSGLLDYGKKRIRRIVPAYVLIVVVCAIFLSLVSTFSFNEYFGSKTFFKYVAANLSFLNFIQPALPGVFTANLYPNIINGSLWTIKVELSLYIFIPFLTLFLKRKPIFILTGLYLVSFVFVYYMESLYDRSGNRIYPILSRQFLGQIRYFTSGIILLFYFDFYRKSIIYFLLPSAIVFILKYYIDSPVVDVFYPFSFAVLIVSFAYYFKNLACFSKYGDFSYGMYLFHFPVIQLIVYFGWFKENPILLFLTCFIIVLSLSILSWHLLEKHFLKRNRHRFV